MQKVGLEKIAQYADHQHRRRQAAARRDRQGARRRRCKLLILDEPTASLNEADSTALLNLLLEFKKQGMTSILISHKLNELAKVAD